MADEGHKLTDRKIEEMEKRIAKEYAQAEREVKDKLDDYFRRFETKDKKWQQWVENGEKTEEQYKAWRTQQMAQGKRWSDLKAQLAQDYNNTNQLARSIIDGYMPEIYALNHNFGLYQIESGGNINTSLTLYNRESVERLMREDPEVLPPPGKAVSKAIAQGKAERWSRQKLQSVMTQGILQGESIPHLATRLATEVGETNRKAAVRNARTMATNAQNAGRYDSYRRAKDIGVDLTIEWSAILDNRTRHDHRMMHGQRREVDEPFVTPDGYSILYPAEMGKGESDLPQREVWNCRCTLLAWVKGFEGETVKHSEDMGDMTFEEWQEAKPEPQDILAQEKKGEAIKESYIREYGGHGGTTEAAVQEVADNAHIIADGKDISETWERRPDQFDFEIEDVINAQGFDGLPRVVSAEEFDEAVKAANGGNGFIAQRSYSAPNQETLDAYRDQLYNGKWYVDCSTGGAQYGQGMYCAADYTGQLTSGIRTEMEHYGELGRDRYSEPAKLLAKMEGITVDEYFAKYGTPSTYVETLTLDPSARIIEFGDLRELKSRTIEGFRQTGQMLEEYEGARERIRELERMNDGSFAAMKGYDAINAAGHGESGSYTVVLNRTKLIILGE